MKRTMLYCAAAAVLGIILVVGPLFVLALFKDKSYSDALFMSSARERFEEMEKATYGSEVSSYSSLDFEIFAICFLIALTVYLLFKRRRPYPETVWSRHLY